VLCPLLHGEVSAVKILGYLDAAAFQLVRAGEDSIYIIPAKFSRRLKPMKASDKMNRATIVWRVNDNRI
jgi:hypothetical protein